MLSARGSLNAAFTHGFDCWVFCIFGHPFSHTVICVSRPPGFTLLLSVHIFELSEYRGSHSSFATIRPRSCFDFSLSSRVATISIFGPRPISLWVFSALLRFDQWDPSLLAGSLAMQVTVFLLIVFRYMTFILLFFCVLRSPFFSSFSFFFFFLFRPAFA